MATPALGTPTNTSRADAVLNAPKPQANTYQGSASASADAIKTETATLGHNAFRPDVYKMTEGMVS